MEELLMRACFCALFLSALLFSRSLPAAFAVENGTASPDLGARAQAEERAVAAQEHDLDGPFARKALVEAFYASNPHLPKAGRRAIPDIDVYDGQGYTRLYKAIWNTDELLVSALLTRGANPNVRSLEGPIPLNKAVEQESLEIVRLLLEAGADPKLDGILNVAGSAAMQRLLRQYNADPAQKQVYRPRLRVPWRYRYGPDEAFFTAQIEGVKKGVLPDSLPVAVLIGCSAGDLRSIWETVKARGGGIDDSGGRYHTALFQAVDNSAPPSVFAFLLENGADPTLYPFPDIHLTLLHEVVDSRRRSFPDCLAITRLMLRAGARINQTDNKGYTPLLWALSFNRHDDITDLIRLLIESGADLKARTKEGNGHSALDLALRRPDKDALIPLLSAKNASLPSYSTISGMISMATSDDSQVDRLILFLEQGLKLRPENGARALRLAMEKKNTRLFDALLKAGVDIDARDGGRVSLLRLAVDRGDEEMVRRSLAAGASVRKGISLRRGTPLFPYEAERDDLMFDAVRSGNVNIVRMLLKAGANPDTPGNGLGGEPPLLAAAGNNRVDIVRALIEGGANVNAGTARGGTTPLVHAVRRKSMESALVLLRAGADPNRRSKRGELPLALAVELGDARLVEELIARKADVNPPIQLMKEHTVPPPTDDTGPLYQAARLEHVEIARLLLRAGANPNGREQDGRTPLFPAAGRDDPALLRLLLEHKADPRAADLLGYTPLHLAVYSNDPENVALLLKAGADPNAAGSFGRTPMDGALDNKSPAVDLLRNAGAKPGKRSE
jgi:cytohesin